MDCGRDALVPGTAGVRRQALPAISLSCPADAFSLFASRPGALPVERVAVAYMKAGGQLIAVIDIAEGGLASPPLPMALILKQAVLMDADAMIVAHNHPTGDAQPSAEDLPRDPSAGPCADALGIELVDHIVVARDGCCSLRLMGLL